MDAQLRRRLEMAARARDFLRAHQTEGVGQDLGLAKLEALLERAENLATQQRTGVATVRAATKQRRDIRRLLQLRILGFLSVVGVVARKQDAELAEQFRMPPSNATHQALLTASRAILEKATAEKDLLVGLGMPEHVLDELGTALGEFEQTLEATSAGRREHTGARAELRAVTTEISEQLRLLDKVVFYQFGDNAELMGAWESARNVLGPFKPKEQQQDPGVGGSQTLREAQGKPPKAA